MVIDRQGYGRLWVLLRAEAVLQWRSGVVAVLLALAGFWSTLLLVLPPATAQAAAPWVLLLETALAGTTIAGTTLILERTQGATAALRVSPVRLGERLAARVGLITVLVVATAVPIAVAARPTGVAGLAATLTAVALTATLSTLIAAAVAARQQAVLSFMVAMPLVLLPLLAPMVAHGAGLTAGFTRPLLYAVPTTGAIDLARAGYAVGYGLAAAWLTAAWLLVACVVAGAVAHRRFRLADTAQPAPAEPRGRTRAPLPTNDPIWTLLRADLAGVARDRLLLLIALSPVLLGLILRFGYPPAREWLAGTHDFALNPYRQLVLALVLLMQAHTAGVVGALLVLDDTDDRALAALRTSPLTLPRYLNARAGLATIATWVGALVVVPLSGLAEPDETPGLAAATALTGLLAPLFMLAVLAVARSKVEGVAAQKVLALGLFLPVMAWWLTGGWELLLAPLPTWWALQAQWTAWPYGLVGVAVAAVWAVPLARRALARLAALAAQ